MKKLPVPGICAQYRQFCSVLIRGRSDLQAADGLGQEALGIIAREPALGIRRAVGIGKDAEHGRARAAHDRTERAAVEQAALDGRDLALAVGEHVLKDVVHPAGEPGHVPVGERGADALRVRAAARGARVHAVEQFRRRDRKIRLADHDRHARHGRDGREPLAAALGQHRAARDTVRHVRADLRTHFLELRAGEARAGQPLERAQHGRRVRRAAAQPRAHGDALVQPDVHAAGKLRAREKHLRRAHGHIVRPAGQVAAVGLGAADARVVERDGHVVVQVHALHDHAQVVKPVGARTEHVQ